MTIFLYYNTLVIQIILHYNNNKTINKKAVVRALPDRIRKMKRTIQIKDGYLYIPIYTGQEHHLLSFYVKDENTEAEKIMEFKIPVDMSKEEEYFGDYYAEIPVWKYRGKTMIIEGEFPMIMGMRIQNRKKRRQFVTNRPRIHFTANRGWTNDPNGMVYKDGLYHLYFQYNPFDVRWENMSWGHAISKDLLHWAQLDTVMFPDEDGTMYSGCGVINERELLGFSKDTLLYYYTEAGGTNPWSQGKEFTQKIAYSNDMGETLQKLPDPCIGTIYRENRDPKIFWHSETEAYIMVLWLKGNDFGIFRSTDLKNWDLTQELYLEDAWECPDLFQLTNAEGEKKWFFWSADGYYFPGDFDGYHFENSGERHKAYISKLPYAAQTFSGIKDRTISIPWLRLENDGRLFTSAYGLPTEFSYRVIGGRYFLLQRPVREFYEQLEPVDPWRIRKEGGKIFYENRDHTKALVSSMELSPEHGDVFLWEINGSSISYNPHSGILNIDGEKFQAGLDHRKLELIVDDRILEIFFEDGLSYGAFPLKEREIFFSMKEDQTDYIDFFEIE